MHIVKETKVLELTTGITFKPLYDHLLDVQ